MGLSASSIRAIHWIISGALDRAVVWGWIAMNPAAQATKPPLSHPDPKPPTAEEAARLVEAAAEMDPDWGAFVWTKATIGARRGEMCALRWRDVNLEEPLLTIRRSVYLDDDNEVREKTTKTHQQRRVMLDPETMDVLAELKARARERASALGEALPEDAYVFSPTPDGSDPLLPATATQRYRRMVEQLGIDTTLKNLRHYSATELIAAGVDPRTVAGRLGHGGGATTLRVYTAWVSEADQRAASTISGRMPPRKVPDTSSLETKKLQRIEAAEEDDDVSPYVSVAADLRGAIRAGILIPGDPLPTVKALAERYNVAAGTAHRAVASLAELGLVTVSRGTRAVVAPEIRSNSA